MRTLSYAFQCNIYKKLFGAAADKLQWNSRQKTFINQTKEHHSGITSRHLGTRVMTTVLNWREIMGRHDFPVEKFESR